MKMNNYFPTESKLPAETFEARATAVEQKKTIYNKRMKAAAK